MVQTKPPGQTSMHDPAVSEVRRRNGDEVTEAKFSKYRLLTHTHTSSLTLMLTHTLTHSHSLTLTHTPSLTLTLTLTYTNTHSLTTSSYSHSYSHTVTLTRKLSLTHIERHQTSLDADHAVRDYGGHWCSTHCFSTGKGTYVTVVSRRLCPFAGPGFSEALFNTYSPTLTLPHSHSCSHILSHIHTH